MAKAEYRLRGNFHQVLDAIDKGIMTGSISASYEDGSNWSDGDVRCAVRVYERYSYFGQNRVSLNVTVIDKAGELFVSAITSGGSQAMFFKINRFGENAFLECLDKIMRRFDRR